MAVETEVVRPSTSEPQTSTVAGPDLRAIWANAMEVLNAQCSIWALRTTRVAVLAGFGLLALAGLLVFLICGLVLLDHAFALLLSGPGIPVWVSPLVRGGLYFSVPAVLLFLAWHAAVGYGQVEKKEGERSCSSASTSA